MPGRAAFFVFCAACRAKATWIEINQENFSTHAEYLATASTMPTGTYHFYLSSDVTYDGDNYVLNMGSSSRNVCLHLNGHDLTAKKNAIAVVAGNAKLNILGTGTVIGNHEHSDKYRGSALVLNAGTTTDPGTIRIYSGTFIQPENNTQYAPVATSWQAGLLEIYPDAALIGNANNYSLYLNTCNGNSSKQYTETVNIYGGTFTRPVYAKSHSSASTPATALNIYGGTFQDGITVISNANVTISGTPAILGPGLKLPEGTTATLGTLEKDASIRVDATGAFTVANTLAKDYLGYFSPAKSGYKITEENNILYCNVG